MNQAKKVVTRVQGVPGLELRARGNYSSWVLRYTAPNGKRREMGLGRSLTGNASMGSPEGNSILEQVVEARRLLAKGVDPIDHRKEKKDQSNVVRIRAKQMTVRRMLRLWMDYTEPRQRWSMKYTKQVIHRVENDPPAWLLDIPATELKSLDVIRALGQMQVSAQRKDNMRQRLEWALEWLVQNGNVDTNAAAVRRAVRGRFA